MSLGAVRILQVTAVFVALWLGAAAAIHYSGKLAAAQTLRDALQTREIGENAVAIDRNHRESLARNAKRCRAEAEKRDAIIRVDSKMRTHLFDILDATRYATPGQIVGAQALAADIQERSNDARTIYKEVGCS